MARYNLLLEGRAEEFLKKIPGRKKSLVINSILIDFLKNRKKEKILESFFTEFEIKTILDFDKKSSLQNSKKTEKKISSEKPDKKEEQKAFQVEL
ncbi:hypothetical protein [Sulfurimonas sp.]